MRAYTLPGYFRYFVKDLRRLNLHCNVVDKLVYIVNRCLISWIPETGRIFKRIIKGIDVMRNEYIFIAAIIISYGQLTRSLFNYRRMRVYRTSLPVPMFQRNDFSIWSVLKNCIGKELSKITMPVVFNEPLSFLQRMTEYMEYARMIRTASEQDDPVERMKYVAGKSLL